MTITILEETFAYTIDRIVALFVKKASGAAGEFTEEISKGDYSSFKRIL